MKTYWLPLIKSEHLTADVYSFYFDITKTDFCFRPGQYIQVKLENEISDTKGNSRYFTIASSPTERNYIMITMRILDSTFKKTMRLLKPGQPVEISGPLGSFVFDEKDVRSKVFLAGGIGVTPFRSMLIYAQDTKYNFPITLITSFHDFDKAIFFRTFKGIKKSCPGFKFIPVFKTQQAICMGLAETGRIDAELIKRHVANPLNSVYYIVGPPPMVESVINEVDKLDVLRENIRFENFTGYLLS